MQRVVLLLLIMSLFFINCNKEFKDSNVDLSLQTEDLKPELFLKNIKIKNFKIKDHDDIHYNLDRKSITQTGTFGEPEKEEFFNLKYSVFKGSFVNRNKSEYLFIIKLDELCSFFSHAESYGNTTLIYIFDDNINQISEVYFKDYFTYLKDIVDLDKDGINEVIMESSYRQQGFFDSWVMIFIKDFDEPKLKVTNLHDCTGSGLPGEKILLKSSYSINENKIIFTSSLKYYIGIRSKKNDIAKISFLRTEYKRDVYEYKYENFQHIIEKENVDWEDERLEF